METRKDGTRVLDGKLLKVDRDTVVLDNGREALREVVRHPGGVCIAALDGENNLWFVRQFRYAMGEDVTELQQRLAELYYYTGAIDLKQVIEVAK